MYNIKKKVFVAINALKRHEPKQQLMSLCNLLMIYWMHVHVLHHWQFIYSIRWRFKTELNKKLSLFKQNFVTMNLNKFDIG